jgi:hypothetical protein
VLNLPVKRQTEGQRIPIPPAQLDRWTNATGATASAQETHQHIRDTLSEADVFNEEPECELHTLLQGSYRTGTLVYGSGDVDIFAINTGVWRSNADSLTNQEQRRYDRDTTRATYGYNQFRRDVAEVLQNQYGFLTVDDSSGPAIKVDSDSATGISLDADVVPVLRYRYYTEYPNHVKGICFDSNSGLTFNFPEQHISEGEDLNSSTDGEFNRTVRMFKNVRNRLVRENTLQRSTVPSYFIECLLSNVPEHIVETNDLQRRYLGILRAWLDREESDFTPQHNVADRLLFGDDPQQWSTEDYATALEGFLDLFDNWEDYS